MSRLTAEELGRRLPGFVGGDMEIQNQNENYYYRGRIKSAAVKGKTVVVQLHWVARAENDQGESSFIPIRLVKDDELDYEASLGTYGVSNIGLGRISLRSITGEVVILFPPGEKLLDPKQVIGLELPEA